MTEKSSLNNSTNTKRYSTPTPSACKICGTSATYSYFGVVSCHPCKMFFKRNAERKQEVLKCYYNGHCEVNTGNRHLCSYCRLIKCFASGMQTERIRSSHATNMRKNKKIKLSPKAAQTISTTLVRLNERRQVPTLNLLQSDQSTLTIEQWTLISNLSHCYDEYSGLSLGERYMHEQNVLPLKLRFKTAPMFMFFNMIINGAQLLYKRNRDFLSLSANDRSILLHNTSIHTAGVSSNFIFRLVGLTDCSAYYNTLEMITHANFIPAARRIANRINFDLIVIKLMLAILSFSTISYTVYSNNSPVNLPNIKQILHIQDTYIELTWRYLLYKYKYEQTIKCFSDLIRCLFAINDGIVEIEEIQWFTNMIDSCIQQTEQTLSLNT